MRKILRATGWFVTLAVVGMSLPALADSNFNQNNQQFGMNLPQATMPSGSDEIRTTDGSTCRSAVGGDGAYMDVGVIGSPESADVNASAAAYGRLVIPIGAKSKRLDCTKLYDLEIQRLKMELELARMGTSGTRNTEASAMNSNWAEEGWSSQPAAVVIPEENAAPKKKATKVKKKAVAAKQEPESEGLY